MNTKEQREAAKIMEGYVDKPKTGLERLKALDKEARRPADVFAYIFGSLGALIMGIGMCLAMPEVAEGYIPLGIGIGIVGIAMMSFNYLLHKRILAKRRSKYSERILSLSDELLNEDK